MGQNNLERVHFNNDVPAQEIHRNYHDHFFLDSSIASRPLVTERPNLIIRATKAREAPIYFGKLDAFHGRLAFRNTDMASPTSHLQRPILFDSLSSHTSRVFHIFMMTSDALREHRQLSIPSSAALGQHLSNAILASSRPRISMFIDSSSTSYQPAPPPPSPVDFPPSMNHEQEQGKEVTIK